MGTPSTLHVYAAGVACATARPLVKASTNAAVAKGGWYCSGADGGYFCKPGSSLGNGFEIMLSGPHIRAPV